MTLAETVRSRKAAVAAAAVAVTATAVVSAVVVADDDPERRSDSLGSTDATAEATPSPLPETTASAAAPAASAEPEESEGAPEPAPDPARQRSPEADAPQEGPPFGGEPYCTTYPAPEETAQPASSGDPTPAPSPEPSPDPTSTALPSVQPAPPSASASSPASPDGDAESPTPRGTTYTMCAVPGRPVRRGADLLLPVVREGGTATDLPVPDVTGLDPRDRAALAALWTDAARGELASVPAFADLALVLSALGAPLDLVGRCAQAAVEEVDHTRRAFAIASAYSGAPVEGGPVPGLLGRRVGQASTPRAALTRLAVEALRDGCLHEGHMAGAARLAADLATDRGVRESLDVVARDEAGHAVLSHDLLAWCLEAGDRRLALRVRRELAQLPTDAPATPASDGDPAVLETHGWPRQERLDALFAAHRTAVVARVEGLLVGSL